MIGPYQFAMLDIADPVACRDYERAFFAAFQRARTNRLARKLWQWDEENRLIVTRVPYRDQAVYLLRDGRGAIEAGMAFNTAMRQFQSAAFGFQAPAPAMGALEVLTFFSVSNRNFRVKLDFWSRCIEAVRARGFRTAYATTAERPLRCYLRFGWELQGETEVEAERRFFLRYDLARSGSRNHALKISVGRQPDRRSFP